MSGRVHVAVVGGGVVGRSLARAAARAGFLVSLIDAGTEATSRVPVALLNPHRGRTGRAHPDDVAALATTWRWADELAAEGRTTGAHRSGVVRVADGPAQARAFARAGLVAVAPEDAGVRAPHGAFRVPDGGWLDPGAWLAALTASARAFGAHVLEGCAVHAVAPATADRWRLHLRARDGAPHRTPVLDVDRVLLALGASDPPELSARLVSAPSVARTAGDLAITDRPPPAWPVAGSTYVGPVATRQGVRAAIGGHHRAPGPPAPDAAAHLRSAIAWALPDLAGDGHDDVTWWGVRARRPSGRPEVHALGAGVTWVGGFAGRGFLAAADVAERVVAELTGP